MRLRPVISPSRKWAAIIAVVVFWHAESAEALTPNEWRLKQTIDVPAGGLVRLNLPIETLDAARPDLADLRILDGAGQEVPYLIDRPMPQPESGLRPKEFQTGLEHAVTRVTLTTGTSSSLNGVTLETPDGGEFIKAVQIEGSHDRSKWQRLAMGEPIFRMRGGASKLRVSFPEGVWEFLRLTIDDNSTSPVPITGAQLDAVQVNAPVETLPITIKSRDESPGVSRIAVDLGAANLTISSLGIETFDPLFSRAVTLAVPELADDTIREQPVSTGMFYRVDLNGKTEAHLEVSIERQIHSREIILLLQNGDSPPLAIKGVHGQRRVARLLFLARSPGRFALLCGNSQCRAPQYDLSEMGGQLKSAAATEIRPSAPIPNPDYKAPDNLAALPLAGASIDLNPWKFRKPVRVSKAGAQEVELDPDVLARADSNQRDLRIARTERQLPFLLERTSISRSMPLTATAANDPKNATLSRWSLKLPQAGLPFTRLVGNARSALFQREMRLWEGVADDRGNTFPRELGHATWRRVPNQSVSEYMIQFAAVPRSDTLFLETDNGDNPAIELHNFRAYYPVTRVIFAAANDPAQPVWLYYGNPEAASPRYDVTLIADQLLRAERATASLGAQEKTNPKADRLSQSLGGSARYIFWGVLALVVIALLLLISRLLPKAQ